jgi:serine/threonine-protein kinase
VLVPVLALFVGAGVAALVLIGVLGGPQAPGPAAAVAADTGGGSGVTLAAADYVGRPVDEVATQLSGLGLTVQRQQDPTSAAPAGTVTRIDPAGVLLRPGDPVRVSYAVPLGTTPSSSRAPRTDVTVRSPADDVASTSSAAPTTAQQPVSAGTPQRTATATSTSTSTSTATSTSSAPAASDPPSPTSTSSPASSSTPSGGGTG